jgi:two-component system chemotaxis sensor kinase CheA
MERPMLVGEDPQLRDQLLAEFVAEALEHLDAAEATLVAAEGAGIDRAGQDAVMRAMHSIKGSASYLGLAEIQQLAHALETTARTLPGMGSAEVPFALLLDGVSDLRRLIEHAGQELPADENLLLALASNGAQPQREVSHREAHRPSVEEVFRDVAEQQCQAIRAASQRLADDAGDRPAGEMLHRAIRSLRSAAEYAGRSDVLSALPAGDDALGGAGLADLEALLGSLTASLPPRGQAQPLVKEGKQQGREATPADDRKATGNGHDAAGLGGTLRVDQARVDTLINQVGELLTARNQLEHFLLSLEAEGCRTAVSRRGKTMAAALGRTIDDLQNTAMELRMVRLDTVFRRLPRVARDVAQRTGKVVRLEIQGGDIELDKGIAEAIADPLVHLVRNAVDHGIEPPAERRAAGKCDEGCVRVEAHRQAHHVIVTTSDDGAGVDLDAVRRTASAKGLLEYGRAAALSDEETYELLFAPGFSTASTITDISGRGVGLDVVRSNICAYGGTVSLTSSPAGTVVEMSLPVRMAAQDVVLVKSDAETFAVPLEAIRETLYVPAARLQRCGGRPAIMNRGRVVPLVFLSEAIGLRGHAREMASLEVMIAGLGTHDVGLVVDEIGQHYQVVVKPMEGYLAVAGVTGAAVLADGRVVLVVDPARLVAADAQA